MPWVFLIGFGVLLAALGRRSGQQARAAAPQLPPPPLKLGTVTPPLTPAEEAIVASCTPDMQRFYRLVLSVAAGEGLRPQLVSGRRTCAEQAVNYAKGRSTPGPIVTDAKGCRSWHVLGRAIDMKFPPSMGEAPYRRMGAIANSLGGKWGILVQGGIDFPHIEYHPGLTIEQACPNPDACEDPPKA